MPYSYNTYTRYRRGAGYFKPKRASKRQKYSSYAIMRNPFSTANNNPKIHDGKTSLSSGQKFQALEPFTIPGDTGIATIVIFPAFAGGCCIYTGTGFSGGTSLSIQDMHGVWAADTTANTLTIANGEVAMWRQVSQGLKITLTNNADENDGWFETARLTVSRKSSDWVIAEQNSVDPALGILNGETGSIRPYATNNSVFGVDLGKLVEHPTYRTGKLRDIHKHLFINRSVMNEHEFRRVRGQHSALTLLGAGDGSADSDRFHDFLDENIDDSFGVLVVRCHGRNTNEGALTDLLLHYCTNQEIVYENGTPLARFHTETYKGGYRKP
jgi:hypothetical protein